MSTIHVDVVSAEESIFSGEAKFVALPGESGELGILPGHIPLITRIKPGAVRIEKADGGEEFVLIIRCSDHDACLATLNRFRLEVEQRKIPQVGHITISMGVAKMERETFAATMVDQADQALYHCKRNGRNQVSFFEDLVAQGLVVVNPIKTDEISFF